MERIVVFQIIESALPYYEGLLNIYISIYGSETGPQIDDNRQLTVLTMYADLFKQRFHYLTLIYTWERWEKTGQLNFVT